MRIEVTQQDIDAGKKGEACNCPVARAIMRMIQTDYVAVTGPEVSIDDKVIPLPYEVEIFVINFDRGEPVEPFGFELPIDYPGTS